MWIRNVRPDVWNDVWDDVRNGVGYVQWYGVLYDIGSVVWNPLNEEVKNYVDM